jgi:hypothetical protein
VRARRRPAGRMQSFDRAPAGARSARRHPAQRASPYDAVLIADKRPIACPRRRRSAAALPARRASSAPNCGRRRRPAARGAPLRGAWFARRRPTRCSTSCAPATAPATAAPYRLASLGYDAVLLTVRIARDWRPGRPFPGRRARDPDGFTGVDGAFRFGRDGVAERQLEVVQVTAGRLRRPCRRRRAASTRLADDLGEDRVEEQHPAGATRGGSPSGRQALLQPATAAIARFLSAGSARRRAMRRGRRPRAAAGPSAALRRRVGGASGVSSTMPWPLRASAASQFSGFLWRWVACRRAGRGRRGRRRDRAGSASKRDCGGSPRRAGVVGDFVGGEAGGFRHRLGQLVERGAVVRIGFGQLALGGERGEAGAGLDGELVEREVAGAEGEGAGELASQAASLWPGQGVDEVEADALERRCAVSSAARPSATPWARPRKRSASSSSDWRPSETRFTPAAARSAKRAASTEEGLASSVISMPGAKPQCRSAASISAATVSGGISEGVPPPKKIEPSGPPGQQRASWRGRRAAPRATALLVDASRTWLLKSQ